MGNAQRQEESGGGSRNSGTQNLSEVPLTVLYGLADPMVEVPSYVVESVLHLKKCRYLSCPNKCNKEHAEVYWEIAGTLDDGTGAVRFIARRDVAKALLGKKQDFRTVEEGAWETGKGILFSQTKPLESEIVDATRGGVADGALSSAQLATYSLFNHCKNKLSLTPRNDAVARKRRYYVRTKRVHANTGLKVDQRTVMIEVGKDGEYDARGRMVMDKVKSVGIGNALVEVVGVTDGDDEEIMKDMYDIMKDMEIVSL